MPLKALARVGSRKRPSILGKPINWDSSIKSSLMKMRLYEVPFVGGGLGGGDAMGVEGSKNTE